jgi:hypothetical protein
MKVNKEAQQAPELRRPLLKKLQKHFQANIISFFTSFTNRNAQITDDDAEMLESLLAVEHQGGKLVLILNSPGGQALAAERIVNVCRAYSDNQFEVVIPHMAKSAATMICFGASKIHMSKTAELGPVDPQVPYKDDAGNERWISAEEYVRSYKKLIEQASGGGFPRIEPFLQQLNRFDAREIEALESAQALSRDISVQLLKSGMMSDIAETDIATKIGRFLSQTETRSHGRMINQVGATAAGLKVDILDLHSEAWHWLWELFVRSDWSVSNICKKIIETPTSSVNA